MVESYDDLRALAGPGTQEIVSGRYAGSFTFSVSDPCTNADDSTTVISASGGGYWVRQSIDTPSNPIQMGWYELYAHNLDMTHWLESMASCYGSDTELYMEATTIAGVDTVLSDFIEWGSGGEGVTGRWQLFEDADTLVITMTETGGIYTMWRWTNAAKVFLGGANKYLVFDGKHPGLGVVAYNAAETPGLLQFTQSGGFDPAADTVWFSGQLHNSKRASINFTGDGSLGEYGTTDDRYNYVYLAGECVNGCPRLYQGVKEVFYDSLAHKDPTAAVTGWDGGTAGCADAGNYQFRSRGGGSIWVDKITGVMSMEYGAMNANIFFADTVGNGFNDPFTVYFKDMGFTGPNQWGYPAGTNVKIMVDWTLMKHDTMRETPGYGIRHIKWVELAHDYGIGAHSFGIPVGTCDAGNSNECGNGGGIECNFSNAGGSIWVGEASGDGNLYTLRDMDIQIDQSASFAQGRMAVAAIRIEDDNGVASDSVYGTNVTLLGDVQGLVDMSHQDTLTASGGSAYQVNVNRYVTSPTSLPHPCTDNLIYSLTIRDDLDVGTNCEVQLDDVVFSVNSSKEVVSINGGATVTVPAGNRMKFTNAATQTLTINGAGTLVCSGNTQSLPYTADGSADDCEVPP